ncbi:hypothetical protein SAMN06295933_0721 [Desulfovibrio gilichinskyi]|uniref:Uncharacterized protein n=2 Tax=Desulfovibrio gilichinskyi TaxID=1519643 RepID=A0A1X7CDI8_9BACT|nr:hypothetical protein SAMN06295933_0721 [Desulfovibrio gilichinskyi]
MKIGTTSTFFNKIRLSNMPEQKVTESIENSSSKESIDKTAYISKIQSTEKPERLNMLSGNFMRADSGEEKNYSLLNLKALKAQDNLMTQYNSMITSVVNFRVYRTDELIASGMSPDAAKTIASGEAQKMGDAASEKIVGDMTEDSLEKEVKEQKEFTEEQTEKVIAEKQKNTDIEAKEEASKTEENLTKGSDQAEKSQDSTGDVSIQAEASVIENVTASFASSDHSKTGSTTIKNIVKTGENVDVLV